MPSQAHSDTHTGASRRTFIGATSAAALATMSTPLAGSAATPAVHPGGSDEIRVALIGCGGRGAGAAADALVAARARPTLAGPTLARWFRQARQLGSK